MRSIKARYILARTDCPDHYSTYLCFVYAIKGQSFYYKIISKWFDILVDKQEYAKSNKKHIVDHLYYLSNRAEEGGFCLENRIQDVLTNSYGFCWAK